MVVAVVSAAVDQVAGARRMSANPRTPKQNMNLHTTTPEYTDEIDFFWLLI